MPKETSQAGKSPTPRAARQRPGKARAKVARPQKKQPKAGRGPGRPTLYCPEFRDAIFADVEKGLSPTGAGHKLGLHPQTISDWRASIPEFADGIEAARQRGIEERLNVVCGARTEDGRPDWRAAAWLLERLEPERFGKAAAAAVSVRVEAHASAGAAVGFVLSEEELQAIQARRAAALGGYAPQDLPVPAGE